MLQLFKTDWREVWGTTRIPDTGSVYTKPEIAGLILDLADYRPDARRLASFRVLEPSCGEGAFVSLLVERLIASEALHFNGTPDWQAPELDTAILAVDISATAVATTKGVIKDVLVRHGCPSCRAAALAAVWTLQTDFLLHDWGDRHFDFVVGNPPYVRMEELPVPVLRQYRDSFRTVTDRADIYVPFFECGLLLLSRRGTLAFICANRFAKNQYGTALRKFMDEHYRVRHYINLEHTQPFLSKVSAYPAIVVLDRSKGEPTHAATIADLEPSTLDSLRQSARSHTNGGLFRSWYPGGAPWVSTCPRGHAEMQELVRSFPTVEASAPGTKVGIGIASGADGVFVLPSKRDDIEPSRLLPLLVTQDIRCDHLAWSGHWLINPFADVDDGSLADLTWYPGLRHYLHANEELLRARHCAKNRDHAWYRTIDRLWPKLTNTPKLVLPDIQPGGIVGYDAGGYYPHHNVYWITSESWDLHALQAILRSSQVTAQIRAHSVELRGGSIRYQAQNLRQVRIPSLSTINDALLHELSQVATSTDQQSIDSLVERLFRVGRATA